MALTEGSVARLRRDYPDLIVMARRAEHGSAAASLWDTLRERMDLPPSAGAASRQVQAVRVPIDGIRGGRSTARCRYELIVDTSSLAQAIPPTWIASPPDSEIKHVNVWPESKNYCKWTGTWLPSICWYKFANSWLQAPAESRTLGAALEYAKQLLNTENHDSPAR